MQEYVGQPCIVCGRPFDEQDDIVTCPECGTPYHRACWKQNGKCINEALHASGQSWIKQYQEQEKEKRAEERRAEEAEQAAARESGEAPGLNPELYDGIRINLEDPCLGLDPEEQLDGISVAEASDFIRTNRFYYLPLFRLMKRTGKKISFKPVYKIAEEKKFRCEKELIKALFDYKGTAKMMLSPSRSHLFKPRLDDIDDIMKIIGQAKRRMKKMGLDQWQDGYPDEETVRNDKRKHQAVFVMNWFGPAAYAAIVFGKDPYYEHIDGKWISDGEPYVTVHRLAVADEFLGLDLAKHVLRFAERKARAKGVRWFRIDTHHDNIPMRNLIRDFGFTFCGVVQVRDGKRMAYEKQIPQMLE